MSRGSTSSAASFAVSDVAGLVLSTFRRAARRRLVQRHRRSLLPRAAGRHNVCRLRRSLLRTVVERRGSRSSALKLRSFRRAAGRCGMRRLRWSFSWCCGPLPGAKESFGCRGARRAGRYPWSCRGTLRGSTSSVDSSVVSWNVAGLMSSAASFAVSNVAWPELSTFLRVAGRRCVRLHRQSLLRCAMGRRRARWRAEAMESLTSCHGTSPGSIRRACFFVDGLVFVGRQRRFRSVGGTSLGATSSAESLVVPWDVAVLDVG